MGNDTMKNQPKVHNNNDQDIIREAHRCSNSRLDSKRILIMKNQHTYDDDTIFTNGADDILERLERYEKRHNINTPNNRNSSTYNNNMNNNNNNINNGRPVIEREESSISTNDRNKLIPALALRCYHLPNNTYMQDMIQYFVNNHPIFGICCHHKLHPIKYKTRILFLFGSIMFGLAITNIMWLYFFYSDNMDNENEPKLTLSIKGTIDKDSTSTTQEGNIVITQSMILLWTVGGIGHAIFDNLIWYVAACICCLSSPNVHKYRGCATYFIIFTVIIITAIATLAVLVRTSIEQSQEDNEEDDNESSVSTAPLTSSSLKVAGIEADGGFLDDDTVITIQDASAYTFLISYAAELVLALLVYNPLVGFILFSGVLGCCGRIPILGGRPYEVRLEQIQKDKEEEQLKKKQQRNNSKRSLSSRPYDNRRRSSSTCDDSIL